MQIFNMHTHTAASHDSEADINIICEEAKKGGLSGLAVTDHCDCEFSEKDETFDCIMRSFSYAKKAITDNAEELTILAGIEMGESIFAPAFAEKVLRSRPWDVVLGSVHAVRIPDWDMPFSTINFSDKNDDFIKRYLTTYFEDMREMILTADFDILSHLTVPLRYICAKFGKQVEIKDYYPQIREILTLAVSTGKALEINTSGCCGKANVFMPNEDIIDMYISLGGSKFTVGSDAHSPERLCAGLSEAVEMLKEKNITSLYYYKDRCPIEYVIT